MTSCMRAQNRFRIDLIQIIEFGVFGRLHDHENVGTLVSSHYDGSVHMPRLY